MSISEEDVCNIVNELMKETFQLLNNDELQMCKCGVQENVDSIFFYQRDTCSSSWRSYGWNLLFTLGSKPLGKLSKCFDMVMKVVFSIDNILEPIIIREFCVHMHL
jgi:hypothetical protein